MSVAGGCVARTDVLKLVRGLYRELRPACRISKTPVHKSQTWKYVVHELKNSSPEGSINSSRLKFSLCQTYLDYLQSSHRHLELVTAYKGKGERSTKETATMVGFGLPNEPKPPRKQKN